MTDEQIKKQVEVIQEATKKALSEGPEACRKFLIDAGIITPEQNEPSLQEICFGFGK